MSHTCPPRPFGVYTMGLGKGDHQPGCPEGDERTEGQMKHDDPEKRKKLMDLIAALARKDERERCARIAENVFPPDSSKCKWGKAIASAIRRSA